MHHQHSFPPVASYLKAYRVLVGEYCDHPVAYGETKSKAKAAFFKDQRSYMDLNFIEFCRESRLLRSQFEDKIVFELPQNSPALSDAAKLLLLSSSDLRQYRSYVPDSVVIPHFLKKLVCNPIDELLQSGIIHPADESLFGAHYKLTTLGSSMRLSLLSQKHALTGSDIHRLSIDKANHIREDRIDLYTLKDLESLVDYKELTQRIPNVSVLIYSQEHGMFWCAEASGYTRSRENAGIYTFQDAWACTHHCGPEKGIAFVFNTRP